MSLNLFSNANQIDSLCRCRERQRSSHLYLPMKMVNKYHFLGISLQLFVLFFLYRLFFVKETVIVHSSVSGKFSNPQTFKSNKKLRQRTVDFTWNNIPRRSRPPEDEMHEKWIVLTTVNPPTADVKKLAGMKGWKVVVIGDTKTPTDWRYVVNILLLG